MNLTTNINISNDIPRIVKWRTLWAQDHDLDPIPCFELLVQVCGADAGGAPFSREYGRYKLVVMDASPSIVLRVNPASQTYSDQFTIASIATPGAYTALAAAYAANAGANATMRKHLAALDAVLVANGVLGLEFA